MYEQIDGLSMGSPLAPILANWFVSKIENSILEDPTIKQPKFYRRYVDDVFAVFQTEDDRDAFFDHLNRAHKNLTFTMETVNTSSNSLPFLDAEVRINDTRFETSVYKKPTNTGVLLNYEAMAPKTWKKAIIKCFVVRAKRISSSHHLFNASPRSNTPALSECTTAIKFSCCPNHTIPRPSAQTSLNSTTSHFLSSAIIATILIFLLLKFPTDILCTFHATITSASLDSTPSAASAAASLDLTSLLFLLLSFLLSLLLLFSTSVFLRGPGLG